MSSSHSTPHNPTNHDTFRSSAHPQSTSVFFTLLPPEIRELIYIECWRLSGCGTLRQHIFGRPDISEPRTIRWTHTPCVTNPAGEDIRYMGFRNASLGSVEKASWLQRLKTEWCLHWACEEADFAMLAASEGNGLPVPQNSLYIPLLTTCKRMYLESLPSIYTTTTFIFTDLTEAASFLSLYTPSVTTPLRNLEFCIRASNLLTELYFPYDELASEGPLPILTGSARLSMSNNPWSTVCDLLVAQTSLNSLRIWFDTRDLRPWHKRVSETRLFGRLFDVRVARRERFVLALPELPEGIWDEGEGVWPAGLGRGHFLEETEGEEAPFRVERGPRPNNWRVQYVHMRGPPEDARWLTCGWRM